MLQLMRKKAQSWMIKVIFGVIIIVFVFFYGYGHRSSRRNVIAEVNGTKIGRQLFMNEYQKAYQNLARLYQSIYKDSFDEGMIDSAGLKARVLNDIINETLMAQEAERLSLRVSPEELQAAIRSNPAFQVDGKFSDQRFKAILQVNRMSLEDFETAEERRLLIKKLTDMITAGGVELSDQEILDAYAMENEKINLRFVRFKSADYENAVSIEDSELEKYYSDNSARFEIPPKIQVQYLVFAPEDFLGAVEVTPDEIRDEYEVNRDEYRVPRKIKVSHILIRPDSEKGEEGTKEARKKAEEILDKAREGEDFGALAKEYSDDSTSAKKGGAMGWFSQGENVPEFLSQAFSLQKGEIAPLVEGNDGFHIVRVDDIQEERVKPLEEVEGEIRKELAKQKSRQLAEDAAQEAFFETYDAKDLAGYATKKGLKIKTTGLFSRQEKVPEVGGDPEFNKQAFSLDDGAVSSPLKIGGKDYLIKVIKREPSRIPEFEEVKEKVREAVARKKSKDLAKEAAEKLLEEARKVGSLAKAAAAKGFEVEETGFFQRANPFVPKVGPIGEAGKEVLSLSPGKSLLQKVIPYGGDFYVMELKEEQKVDMEKFASEKDQYRKRLYAQKRARLLQQWLRSLREKSEIRISQKNLPL